MKYMNDDNSVTPVRVSSFRYRLCLPNGTLLARCPSKVQALKTAEALFDDLQVHEEPKTGVWKLYEKGKLKARISALKERALKLTRSERAA